MVKYDSWQADTSSNKLFLVELDLHVVKQSSFIASWCYITSRNCKMCPHSKCAMEGEKKNVQWKVKRRI